jgi:hypothetical protein
MSKRIDFDLNDLTNSALKRLVRQLLTANDSEEKEIMRKLSKPQKNDLADLHEEMHGKPNTPEVDEGDAFDLEVSGEEGDSESDAPKKKGKK